MSGVRISPGVLLVERGDDEFFQMGVFRESLAVVSYSGGRCFDAFRFVDISE